MQTKWQPAWMDESHQSAWERVKEAVRRDWEQTKHDLKFSGGHQLNQGAADTIKQAMGSEAIPARDRPNPAKVIGSWDDAEMPIGYGYTAHQKFGAEHPIWNEGIELRLRSEWDSNKPGNSPAWNDVKPWVQHGYEYKRKP